MKKFDNMQEAMDYIKNQAIPYETIFIDESSKNFGKSKYSIFYSEYLNLLHKKGVINGTK